MMTNDIFTSNEFLSRHHGILGLSSEQSFVEPWVDTFQSGGITSQRGRVDHLWCSRVEKLKLQISLFLSGRYWFIKEKRITRVELLILVTTRNKNCGSGYRNRRITLNISLQGIPEDRWFVTLPREQCVPTCNKQILQIITIPCIVWGTPSQRICWMRVCVLKSCSSFWATMRLEWRCAMPG